MPSRALVTTSSFQTKAPSAPPVLALEPDLDDLETPVQGLQKNLKQIFHNVALIKLPKSL